MEKLIALLLIVLTAAGVLLLAVPLRIAGGAAVGWVAGLFFPETMHMAADLLREGAAPWQLGLVLGFVSSFFVKSGRSEGTGSVT